MQKKLIFLYLNNDLAVNFAVPWTLPLSSASPLPPSPNPAATPLGPSHDGLSLGPDLNPRLPNVKSSAAQTLCSVYYCMLHCRPSEDRD